jgi:hypothetical protein
MVKEDEPLKIHNKPDLSPIHREDSLMAVSEKAKEKFDEPRARSKQGDKACSSASKQASGSERLQLGLRPIRAYAPVGKRVEPALRRGEGPRRAQPGG